MQIPSQKTDLRSVESLINSQPLTSHAARYLASVRASMGFENIVGIVEVKIRHIGGFLKLMIWLVSKYNNSQYCTKLLDFSWNEKPPYLA